MSIYRDPNILIEVTLDETFTIELESVPSTGYTWHAEYDSTMLDLIGPPEPPEVVPPPSTIGGSKEEPFVFQAKQAGETQIELKYQRVWETRPREVALFRVHIVQ
jgi:predicted secreted protein